jgi:hypothetical protein
MEARAITFISARSAFEEVSKHLERAQKLRAKVFYATQRVVLSEQRSA